MATEVIMPKFGMSQEVGQVIQWLKAEGEAIKEGEPLLEVMTDKVTMEVEAPASGILVGVLAESDEIVPVAETIAYIIDPDEAFQPPTEPSWREKEAVRSESAKADHSRPEIAVQRELDAENSTPVAQRMAADLGLDLADINGSGRDGKITRTDVLAHLAKQVDGGQGIGGFEIGERQTVRAAPNARRIARQFQLDLSGVRGSGPSGRIQGKDVVAHLSGSSPAGMSSGIPREIPLDGIRRIIAERMSQSAQTAPHITLEIEADTSRAQALRDEANQRLPDSDRNRLTLTSLWVKITAWALAQHPLLNASFQGDSILLHPDINIGIATALDDGLIVPVIRAADQKDLLSINNELKDLSTRARDGTLQPEHVSGGTFTLSNLGMYGITRFSAIINPPESGILAIGAIQAIPVVEADNHTVAIRPMMNLSLSADHRVVDGAGAARFLMDLKRAIEDPDLLLL